MHLYLSASFVLHVDQGLMKTCRESCPSFSAPKYGSQQQYDDSRRSIASRVFFALSHAAVVVLCVS